jgi:hypothetical protein
MTPAILTENERCAPSGAFLGSAQPCHTKFVPFLTCPYWPFGDSEMEWWWLEYMIQQDNVPKLPIVEHVQEVARNQCVEGLKATLR